MLRTIRWRLLTAALALPLVGCATGLPQTDQSQAGLFPGVRYEQQRANGPVPARYHIVSVDLAQPGLRLAMTPADRSGGMEHIARLTSSYLAERHAQLAINASYFLPFKGGSKGGEDYYPHEGDPASVSGAEIADGQTVSPVETDLDERVDSMLCFRAGRARILDGQICPKGYTEGVAAGPRLLADGAERASALRYATGIHPRTAFGISRDGRKAWIVVVDGRQEDSKGAALADLTVLFRSLGAWDAINLDGGGSSTLAVEDPQGRARVLNTPIHTGIAGRERPVANHILLFVPHRHANGGSR